MNCSSVPLVFLLFLLLSVSDYGCRSERGRESEITSCSHFFSSPSSSSFSTGLRFGKKSDGQFKILQIADMHYANGKDTGCLDVEDSEKPFCTDLNTTAFIYRVIQAENPDLVVFTGDNIFGPDTKDPVKSIAMAFAPVIQLGLPWAAVLGNHDQEGSLSREQVMRQIAARPYALAQLNPTDVDNIDGFGNYNLKVAGAEGSSLANKSLLNLFFLDSGDYSTDHAIKGYGWIKQSQQDWFKQTSFRLQEEYKSEPHPQKDPAPALTYFHIPQPEFNSFNEKDILGVKQEWTKSPSYNSGFFKTMAEDGSVKAALVGHDHINDFCGNLTGIHLCNAGGFGYHAYGKAGWPRRARIVSAYLEKTVNGEWGGVESIDTWKRLDDERLTVADHQRLWNKGDS